MYELRCSNCDGEIQEGEKYLSFENIILCDYCIEQNTEELDSEGEYADEYYDNRKDGD